MDIIEIGMSCLEPRNPEVLPKDYNLGRVGRNGIVRKEDEGTPKKKEWLKDGVSFRQEI